MKKYLSLTLLAYLAIIFIWSTTPLAIKWSSVGVDYITGLSLRMFLGTAILVSLTLLLRKRIPLDKDSLKAYMASSLGMFGAMFLVYWGAQGINSGLISVIYGLSPIITSIISVYIFQQEKLSFNKIIGALLGCFGLVVIFSQHFIIDTEINLPFPTTAFKHYLLSALAILGSVILHAYSAVLIKQIPGNRSAFQITMGGLLFSLPLFLIVFIFIASPLPEYIPSTTIVSIVYLGFMGTVIGFMSYYYVLSKLAASTVSLSLFITPVCALLIGKTFNSEIIETSVIYGTGLILMALIIHLNLIKIPSKVA